MIFAVRTARPEITISGQDYFSKLAPYFLSMSFTDNCDGKKADDLEIKLADRDKRFIRDWMPDKGTFIDAAIIAERWFSPNAGGLKLDCGRFWIDSVEFSLPDHTVSIKASSIPTDAHIKGSDETRGWEKTTLQDVADQIARENKMTVDWQADHNPKYTRIEQLEESGLAFLKKRANDAKLAIKVCRSKIIFFDELSYESKAAAMTIVYGDMAGGAGLNCYRMSGGHFVTQLTDKTKAATVSHTSLATGKMSKGFAETSDPELTGGKGEFSDWMQHTAEGTDDADEDNEEGESDDGIGDPSLREGESELTGTWQSASGNDLKAQSVVRDKNKDKENAKIQLSIGNPLIAAGTTFLLKGVGQYDGNYFIVSAHHTVGPEYNTELEVRRCLKGV
jgi:Bacteriophage probable baseplate hub protein